MAGGGLVRFHRRLIVALVLPTLVGAALLAWALADLLSQAAPLALLGWLVPGLLLGGAVGWLTPVAWNSAEARIELVGRPLLLLVGYVALRAGVRVALSALSPGLAYAGDAAALTGAGLVLGRSVGLAARIARTLRSRPAAGA